MKRGLKALQRLVDDLDAGSYNRFPDEKGTESEAERSIAWGGRVATVSPMKRGLKVRAHTHILHRPARYNRFPDEKGTESR